MNELIRINDRDIQIKEYLDKRVVTFRDIDEVHGINEGSASRNFYNNKKRLKEGEDFFKLSMEEMRSVNFTERANPQGITLITESGYLMIVKSLTDDLSWKVQRQLIRDNAISGGYVP